MTISQRLELILKDLGITQKRFAEKIGADPSRFSKTMNGKSGLGLDELQKIHTSFGININWLLCGSGKMKEGYDVSEGKFSIVNEEEVAYESQHEIMLKLIKSQEERIAELKEQVEFWKMQSQGVSKKQPGVK